MDLWTVSHVALWVLVIVEGLILIVVLRAIGLFMLSSREAIERDGLGAGTRAPDFTVVGAADHRVQLSQFEGSWLVLLFAFPTCTICRELLPSLAGLSRDLGRKVKILLLLKGDLSEARLFEGEELPPVQVFAAGQDVFARYRVRVSPFVHVVDPEGVIRAKGLVNRREGIEHLLADAGFQHPKVSRHRKEEVATGGVV